MFRVPASIVVLIAVGALHGAGADVWVDLTPNASFEGWTRVPIPGVSVIKPYNQWSVEGQTLVCRGDGEREWLRYDEELGDFILRAEWKATARDGRNMPERRKTGGIKRRGSKGGRAALCQQSSPSPF